MALHHSLHLEEEAATVEAAVEAALESGLRTKDIAAGGAHIGTVAMGDAVVSQI
jgi:3-isopropylmalate dehydrogenase